MADELRGVVRAADGRLTDRLAVGVLTGLLHRELVDEVVEQAGRRERRVRLLPARVTVYFVLAMCLFFGDGYEEVMRKLVGGLRFLGGWSGNWKVPTTGAITQARARLGEEPLRLLFERVGVPLAGPDTKGAWLRSWRMMAIDGVQLELPDTVSNTEAFGKNSHRDRPGPFPQARVVGLGECGTRAVIAARIGPLSVGERELTEQLLPRFQPGMLVMADRGFYSLALWVKAAETGADLLWRVSENVDLPVLEVFSDGSYRSVLADAIARQRHRRHLRSGRADARLEGLAVRVVEYQVVGRAGSGDRYRMITSILDPDEAPALELAAAYHQRWEFEVALAEIETYQRGPARPLRSKSPEMVRQEIWALLTTHYAIRNLMHQAADGAGLDPDRMSFIRSLRVVRRLVTDQAAFSP
ncbi:IS4 family transposase [Streptomyces sp. NPDC051546]|uniref:IS4 family transposase n=1 Tax=Streptomyces sp. NPDC051546 TaxID=3365655 RepID=UPI003794FA60